MIDLLARPAQAENSIPQTLSFWLRKTMLFVLTFLYLVLKKLRWQRLLITLTILYLPITLCLQLFGQFGLAEPLQPNFDALTFIEYCAGFTATVSTPLMAAVFYFGRTIRQKHPYTVWIVLRIILMHLLLVPALYWIIYKCIGDLKMAGAAVCIAALIIGLGRGLMSCKKILCH